MGSLGILFSLAFTCDENWLAKIQQMQNKQKKNSLILRIDWQSEYLNNLQWQPSISAAQAYCTFGKASHVSGKKKTPRSISDTFMTFLSAHCVVWSSCFQAVTSHGAYLPSVCIHLNSFNTGSDIFPENCNKIFNKVPPIHVTGTYLKDDL